MKGLMTLLISRTFPELDHSYHLIMDSAVSNHRDVLSHWFFKGIKEDVLMAQDPSTSIETKQIPVFVTAKDFLSTSTISWS